MGAIRASDGKRDLARACAVDGLSPVGTTGSPAHDRALAGPSSDARRSRTERRHACGSHLRERLASLERQLIRAEAGEPVGAAPRLGPPRVTLVDRMKRRGLRDRLRSLHAAALVLRVAHPPKHLADPPAVKRAYERVRALCLALDGVYEKEAWGEPTFRVEKGKMFLMFADDHHGDGRVGFWCMSTADAREALLEIDADRFYVPPYMGPSGWVGVQITGKPPWDIVEEVIREGHRMGAAPKAKTRLRAGVPAKPSATSKATRTRTRAKTTANGTTKP